MQEFLYYSDPAEKDAKQKSRKADSN